MAYSYYRHTNSKTETLAHPHYSDPRFNTGGGAVIFGQKQDGLDYEYDDRLMQWDYEKHQAAWETAVSQHGKQQTAGRVETYLRHYYNDDGLELLVIIAGARMDNGYPWYAYGFRRSKKDTK